MSMVCSHAKKEKGSYHSLCNKDILEHILLVDDGI